MEIGVIGAGNVGGTLGRRWAQAGHKVVFGVRDPHEEKAHALLASAGSHARAGRVAAASEVVVLTVPWEAAHDAARSAGDLMMGASPGAAADSLRVLQWSPWGERRGNEQKALPEGSCGTPIAATHAVTQARTSLACRSRLGQAEP